ncbi:2-oxoacid:acceptor oxidoreductase family protein [Vulcanisaeta sp. JCM 16161]|uniref:2-oxoacid:acceptor oxidoreductase family protein n=1 Tax=Vulcanisaeta sp. JCM 16161 TaxID=1295372 RepID=UPI000AC58FE9|nr:2-oxoacid:acceptor oxidoreductase family protein [Vulcanisaeta sp. JCM 16161]
MSGSTVEITFFGRGGQGAVTAAQIIAQAAIRRGLFASSFPEYGAERRGAPVRLMLGCLESLSWPGNPSKGQTYLWSLILGY